MPGRGGGKVVPGRGGGVGTPAGKEPAAPPQPVAMAPRADPLEGGYDKEIIDDTPWDVNPEEHPADPWYKVPPGYTVETQKIAAKMEETLATVASFVSTIDGWACGGVGGAASSLLNATQISGTSALLGAEGADYTVPGPPGNPSPELVRDYIDYADKARERVPGFGMAAAANVAYNRVFSHETAVLEKQALSALPIAYFHMETVIQAVSVAGRTSAEPAERKLGAAPPGWTYDCLRWQNADEASTNLLRALRGEPLNLAGNIQFLGTVNYDYGGELLKNSIDSR